MLINYLKVAWRNLMKHKAFSFINVFGLAAGLTCCILISLYLQRELHYDSYHKNSKTLYQVGSLFIHQGKESKMAATPAPLSGALVHEFPEIVQSARLMSLVYEDKTLLSRKRPGTTQQTAFYETKGYLADSNFFNMFSYRFVEGDPATALNRPATVVLSEETAKKIFGNQPALNQVIHISSTTNGDRDFMVTGVFSPGNLPSHIDGKFFMSMNGGEIERFIRRKSDDFVSDNMFYTYVQLKPGSDPRKLEAKFPAFMDKYAAKDLKAAGFGKGHFLVPVKDIHLSADLPANVTPPGSRTSLYILFSIALFTLLIACINFMNLATARSSKRSAEVGVRKVLGAKRRILVMQFLGESVLISLIALFFAWMLSLMLLPAFSLLTGSEFSLSLGTHLPLIAASVALAVFTGLLAGSYPAFYLSSFKPVQVLKGRFKNSFAAASLRKGLVVFQFTISVVLIISTMVINKQMHYLHAADLGFTKAEQVVIPLRTTAAKQTCQVLKNELQRNPQVRAVGASYYYPGIYNLDDNLFFREGETTHDGKRTRLNYVDEDFLPTLGIKAVAGRLFSKNFPSDTSGSIILNENAIHTLGYRSAEEAIGKRIYNSFENKAYDFTIVGVVNDFHFESLQLPITPYGFILSKSTRYSYLVVHARPGETASLLKFMESSWRQLNPDEPFEYSFLDEDFQKNYRAEERLSAMIRYFTLMAILISCLGLFGLASFSAEQRIKEIGIRKVLGASAASIVLLLSRDFLRLVITAVVIASPLAWLVMHKWLQDFAYSTPIGWAVFLFSFAIALFIALFTISFQAFRSALANPVKSLKTE